MKISVLKALRSPAAGDLFSAECSWGNMALSYKQGKRQEIVDFVSATVVFMILRFLPFVFQFQASGWSGWWLQILTQKSKVAFC